MKTKNKQKYRDHFSRDKHRLLDYLFLYENDPNNIGECYRDKSIDIDPTHGIELLTDIFLNSKFIFKEYEHKCINAGLGYLLGYSGMVSSIFIEKNRVSIGAIYNFIDSIYFLFEQLFYIECSKRHNENKPLDYICNMWWDFFPEVESEKINKKCIEIMSLSLSLNSLSCQESALHGLGHMQHRFPEIVKNIINSYLLEPINKDIKDQLYSYAIDARNGNVV